MMRSRAKNIIPKLLQTLWLQIRQETMEEFVAEVRTLVSDSIGVVRNRHVNYIRFYSSISFYQKYLLFFMFCVYANDHLSRYLVNYQYAEPSEDSYHSLSMATNISSFGYGNVIGFGFSLSFVFFGMWAARMINDYSPRNLLLFALITWSTGTFMLGRATNFGNLMGARIILGLGQAFCIPAAYSLLTHHFPQDDYTPLVRSIFGYGAYTGTALSSISLLFLEDFGWRSCCTVVGSAGFCLVIVLYFTVKSPPKRERAVLRKELRPLKFTIEDVFLEIMDNNALLTLFGAACIRFMAEYTLASFLPLFFLNKFPDQKLSFSILNALILLFVGGISSVLGSSSSVVLALDKPGSVRGSCTLLLLLIFCTLLSIPALLLTLLSPSFYLSVFGLLLLCLLSEWWFRPFLFVFQRELSPEARNIALGFLSATSTLSGSVACTVVGYFIGRKDDNLHGNVHVPPKNVTISLSWSVGVIYFLSVLLFAVSTTLQ
jgi:MFS family permease